MTFDVNMVVYLLGLASTAGAMIGKIAALEKKVDMHNQLIDRTYKLEKDVAILQDHVEVFAHENSG